MKFIKMCEKERSECEKCINESSGTETQKALRLGFLDLPTWTPCEICEETEEDKQRHKEVSEWLKEQQRAEEESAKWLEEHSIVFD